MARLRKKYCWNAGLKQPILNPLVYEYMYMYLLHLEFEFLQQMFFV